MKEKKINLIIYRLSAMGDVSMMVPLILALKQEYKDIKITVVSNVFFMPFFQTIDSVDFIGIDTSNKHKGFWGIFKIFKEIYTIRPTHFADLHSSLRSRIIILLLKFSRVKSFSLDKGRGEKKALVRVENKIFKPLQHTLSRYQDVLQRLGFKLNLEKPNFLIQEKIPEKYTKFFNKDFKTIGIAPFAKHEAKIYPLRLMQKVIDQLAQNKENFIFLLGGKNELEALYSLKGLHTNVLVVDCSFKEELALISNLSVMLS
ncbi:MAG: glycosyltransferase family 9 protein, partial [Flavobacterium sp.]